MLILLPEALTIISWKGKVVLAKEAEEEANFARNVRP